MENHAAWNQQSDRMLKHLYEDKKILSWVSIAEELTRQFNQNFTRDGCRNRYIIIGGQVAHEQWSYEEQQELYRLHNQNGNKWAVIAYNLLGRTDNEVKNRFHSKLRKSLRTLNKIGKTCLRKSVQEVNDGVIYKLAEATDQALKENPEISEELISLCYDLKTRLLNYDFNQKDIKEGYDYTFEQSLLVDLNLFNRNYRKKPKREKNSAMGTENLKRLHERKRREKELRFLSQNMYQQEKKQLADHQEEDMNHLNQESNGASQSSIARSTISRKIKTLVLKAPSFQLSSPKFELISPLFPKQIKLSAPKKNVSTGATQKSLDTINIQNVLRDQGVLEEQQENDEANEFFRRERSCSSASSGNSFSNIKSNSVKSNSDFDFFEESRNRMADFDSLNDMQELEYGNNSIQN